MLYSETDPESYITDFGIRRNPIGTSMSSLKISVNVNEVGLDPYRGTSLIRNRTPLGPYSRTMPRALSWS